MSESGGVRKRKRERLEMGGTEKNSLQTEK